MSVALRGTWCYRGENKLKRGGEGGFPALYLERGPRPGFAGTPEGPCCLPESGGPRTLP